MLNRIKTRLSSLFRRQRYERELDRELTFHVDMLTEHNVRGGMGPAEARTAALKNFGQIDRVKDDVRDTWLSRLWETLMQDVRYGLRNVSRNPGFAFVVIFTMALGIGANTAIFSVVNGVLLRPLPFRNGEQLVVLRQQQPLAGVEDMGFSYKEILDYRTAKSLDGVVEFHNMWFILLGRAEPERVSTGVVSANFFDVLGIQPMYGRSLQEADDAPGAPAVLLLSHKYLEAQLRRRPHRRRQGVSDERSTAPGRRHPATGSAISARSRCVHADLRLPVSRQQGGRRESQFPDRAYGIRANAARCHR